MTLETSIYLEEKWGVNGETLDRVRFDPPADFKGEHAGDHFAYARIDEHAKIFCQLGIYSSRVTTGAFGPTKTGTGPFISQTNTSRPPSS